MKLLKLLERVGRRFLIHLAGLLFASRQRKITLSSEPAILVVRLDERIGNLVLTTPLLSSLKERFPHSKITVLANKKSAGLLREHPDLDEIFLFEKKALLKNTGPLRTIFRVRSCSFELAIDATNPLDPSVTQAFLIRLSGAKHKLGFDYPGFGRLFSSRVNIQTDEEREIPLRLRLLGPLPGEAIVSLPTLPTPTKVEKKIKDFLKMQANQPYSLLNLGARLPSKTLSAETYIEIGQAMLQISPKLVLTYGPKERELADEVAATLNKALLAPPTDLNALRTLMTDAQFVVSCDTGPMHIAVACGSPTAGIFVSTEPERFGYHDAPHLAVDIKDDEWFDKLKNWLGERSK